MRGGRLLLIVPILFAWACESSRPAEPRAEAQAPAEAPHENEHARHHEQAAAGPQPTRTLPDGARLFGSELSADRSPTSLSTILGAPGRFAGQVVRCDGEIAQVCQRMGCWMELREGEQTVRIPMAGHSFFLPRDVAGRRATVEGTVRVRELSPDEQAHFREEGATVVAQNVEIEATGVVVR